MTNDGVFDGFGTHDDPTSESDRIRALALENRRLRLMLDHTSDIVVIIDSSGRISEHSASLSNMLGFTDERIAASNAVALVHAEDREYARAQLTSAIALDTPTDPFVIRVLTADGPYRRMECVAHGQFQDRAVSGVILTMHDITERYLLSQLVTFQSTHDRLTELPNRHLLHEHIRPAIARATRAGSLVALCTFSILDLAELNDQLGHDAGDELLKQIAMSITGSIRASDSAARLSDDEFAILLDPIQSPGEAVLVSERLTGLIRGPHSTSAGVTNCQAAVGIAIHSASDTPDSLVLRSSRALHVAKARGANEIELAASDYGASAAPLTNEAAELND